MCMCLWGWEGGLGICLGGAVSSPSTCSRSCVVVVHLLLPGPSFVWTPWRGGRCPCRRPRCSSVPRRPQHPCEDGAGSVTVFCVTGCALFRGAALLNCVPLGGMSAHFSWVSRVAVVGGWVWCQGLRPAQAAQLERDSVGPSLRTIGGHVFPVGAGSRGAPGHGEWCWCVGCQITCPSRDC
jgi:hypothetical protein